MTGSGEPLISPDLPAILAHARQSDCAIAFNTNGTLWTQERADQVVELGIDEIRFSIDGATKATFERIRVNAKFEKVCDAVRMLVATRRRRGAVRPRVSFSSNLMRSSIEELPAIVDLAADLGAATVYANNTIIYEAAMEDEALVRHRGLTVRMVQAALARAVARGIEFINNLADVTGELAVADVVASPPAAVADAVAPAPSAETPSVAPAVAAVAAPIAPAPVAIAAPAAPTAASAAVPAAAAAPGEGQAPAPFELPKSPCSEPPGREVSDVESMLPPLVGLPADLPDIVHACSRPWTGLYVENDGYVRVCCFDAPAIGNLDEQSFAEIWNGLHAQQLRRSFLEGKPPEACQKCFIFAKYQQRDEVFVQPYETGRSHIDAPGIESKLFGVYPVQGWAIEPDGVERVEVLLDNVSLGASACDQQRPDVAAAYPGFPDGQRCGFLLQVDTAAIAPGPHVLNLIVHTRTGRRIDGTERLVQVVR